MRRRSLAALLPLCGLLLAGCGSGTRDAGDLIDAAADRVEEQWSLRVADTLTGASLATASAYGSEAGPSGTDSVVVEALDWSGNRDTDDGAVVLLRFVGHVEASDSQAIFGTDVPEDDETRCYRFAVGVGQGLHDVDRDEVDCPDGAEARTPPAPDAPTLPDDVEDRTRAVLSDPDEPTLLERVQAAFPEDGLTLSTGADDGRLVVAVGTGPGGDCSVVVRERDGSIEAVGGFPREWLMAGEVGCAASLVLDPPL